MRSSKGILILCILTGSISPLLGDSLTDRVQGLLSDDREERHRARNGIRQERSDLIQELLSILEEEGVEREVNRYKHGSLALLTVAELSRLFA